MNEKERIAFIRSTERIEHDEENMNRSAPLYALGELEVDLYSPLPSHATYLDRPSEIITVSRLYELFKAQLEYDKDREHA